MEASALPAPAAGARTGPFSGSRPPHPSPPLLRLRSDEQLVALFRAGHDDAFRVIHDRYRQRLFAYTRQMLPHRADAEDALQDIFVRAYSGLRANHRELALRAWLYRVAHNRCIDELRRPSPPPPEVMELLRSPVHDPIAEADRRESLRRLIADIRRLPDQQRSALLMRELGGMSYADMAGALGVTVPAVKSLLVRARLALAKAHEARDTACSEIREELIVSHDRGLRPNATARRHMRDCPGCREFRHQLRGVSRRLAAVAPTLGPLGVLANLLGVGGGSGAAGGALAAGGAASTGSAAIGVGVGTVSAGATHMATLLAATVVTAGGAVELQHSVPASHHPHHHARVAAVVAARPAPTQLAHAVAVAAAELPAVPPPAVITATATAPGPAAARPAKAASSTTSTVSTTLSTTTMVPTKRATKVIGGAPTVTGVGDISPSGQTGGNTSSTGSASSNPSAGGTTSATGTTAGQPGQAPAGSTSSPQAGSTSPDQPASSAPSTGNTPGGSGGNAGTGSSTGTLGASPPPAP